jgi:formamidase
MITPEVISGHEVSVPLEIEGAEPGDALAIKIKAINILSLATMSGSDKPIPGMWAENGDPATFTKCPGCGRLRPKSVVKGTGPKAIKCAHCGTPVNPFEVAFGYTVMFDESREFALTLPAEQAQAVAERARHYAALPEGSIQHPATVLGSSDLVGVWSRLRPFVGNIGVIPAKRFPAMKNTRDIAVRELGSKNEFSLTEVELSNFPDCHLDCADIRAGSIFIVPVKVPGAGFYLGDVHAVQGTGEIAGHTLDVSAEVVVELELLKSVNIKDSLLLPNYSDLPDIARPLNNEEAEILDNLASKLGFKREEEVLPFQVIGTSTSMNEALTTAVTRMSNLTGLSENEVRNRVTIAGDGKMARRNGVMQLTMLTPVSILDKIGIRALVEEKYKTT